VSLSSIVKAEDADDVPAMHTHTLRKIQVALEGAGAEFGTDGTTVRTRRQP
jgi:hypothetical protein